MATPAPRIPGNSQNVFIIFAIATFALLGGEYYVLTHRTEVAVARAQQLIEAQRVGLSPAEKLAARKARIEQMQHDHRTGIITKPNKGKAVSLSGVSEKIGNKLLVKAAGFYASYGFFLRSFLLLGALLLAFIQKAPVRQPGKSSPKRANIKTVRIVVAVCAGFFLVGSWLLLSIHTLSSEAVAYLYPAGAGMVLGTGLLSGMMIARAKRPDRGLSTDSKKMDSSDGFSLPTTDGRWINVPNAFRGTLVLGGAGAGKTYSVGEPIVEQFAEKNFAGLIYDYKFPVLAEVAQRAIIQAERKAEQKKDKADSSLLKRASKLLSNEEDPGGEQGPSVQLHVVNFYDLTRTERINPLRPEDMPVIAYAEEYSQAIINNLNTESIKRPGEFFAASAIAYLTGIIWFYRKRFPQFCTIPHVVATVLYKDFRHVLSMLDTDLECGDKVRSIVSAVELKADKQLAGVIASLQVIISRINSPEIVWVLTPDESRGEGFSLKLNDPEAPKLLCIGNYATLQVPFSPVISCIIAVATKLMNQPNRHPSYVFLDEAATIYVPGLETLPATARSNKIATIYMTQDVAQMNDMIGRDKMQVMVSNLNNWFFGKVNNPETAELISRMVGREDFEMLSSSSGQSRGMAGHRNRSTGTGASFQERNVVRLQDAVKLKRGEFIGQTVETDEQFFQGTISRPDPETLEKFPLEPFVSFENKHGIKATEADALHLVTQANFLKVREEVRRVIEQHPNTLAAGVE